MDWTTLATEKLKLCKKFDLVDYIAQQDSYISIDYDAFIGNRFRCFQKGLKAILYAQAVSGPYRRHPIT